MEISHLFSHNSTQERDSVILTGVLGYSGMEQR